MSEPLFHEYIDEILQIERESFSDPWTREMFESLMTNPHMLCFVLVESNEPDESDEFVTGYAVLCHIFSEGELQNIAVRSDQRRRRVAYRLMTQITDYAEESGIETITLEVRKSNTAAINLYKKFGFREIDARKNYYKKPVEDAVIMLREYK